MERCCIASHDLTGSGRRLYGRQPWVVLAKDVPDLGPVQAVLGSEL